MAQGYDLRITVTGEDKASAPIGGIKGALSGLSGAFSGLASAATLGAAGAVAGLAAVGAAGLAAWGDYDAALDTVMQKTGVTGDALDTMGESIKRISGSTAGVGTDMAHIGEVMADLQVRTGATGGTLDELTGRLLQLQQVQGDTAVSAQNFGRLLGDWAVPAEQGAGLMDQLFTASQKFGVSTDSLASKLVQFGSPLRQMGFDLQTSIAMFGQFEQQGVNTELVLGSLRIAAGKFADAHIPLQQGLSDTIKRIHDMSDSSAALGVAMDVFGARAGPDMAAAIREGKFSLDDAVASLQNYQGSIQSAAEGAMDFPDQWAMGMNQVKVALVPVGQALMDLGSAAMPLIQAGFNLATGALTSFAAGLSQAASFIGQVLSGGISLGEALQMMNVPPGVADGLLQIVDAVQAVIAFFTDASMPVDELRDKLATIVPPEAADALAYLAGRVFDLGTALSSLASGDLSGFAGSLLMVFTANEGAANDLIGTLDSLSAVFPDLMDGISPLEALASALESGAIESHQFEAAASPLGQALLTVASVAAGLIGTAHTLASIVGGVLSSAFQTAGQVAHVVLAGLPALFQAVAGPVQSIVAVVQGLLISAFANAGSVIHSVLGIVPGLVQTGMAVLTALASTVGNVVAGAFQLLAPIATSVMTGIANIVQATMPSVLALAQSVGSLLVAAFNVLQSVALAVFHAIQPYIPAIQNAIATLSSWVGSVLSGAFTFLANVIQSVVIPGLTALGGWLVQQIPVAVEFLASAWTSVLQPALMAVWGFIQGSLLPLFGQVVAWLQTNIPAGLAALSGFWQQHGDKILSIAQTAWDLIKGAIDGVLNTITTLWQAFQLAREGDWRGFGEKLREIWDGAWEAIKNAITTVGPQIVTALVQLGTDAKNAFLEIDWVQLGSDVIRGIGRGVTSMGSWLADLAREAAKGMLDAAKGFLGIHSPSTVMAEQVGAPMAQGIAAGFLNGMDGGAIVSMVAGIRSLMEQLAGVLANVGDALSTSDWEDLANPVARMADVFKSLNEVGRSLVATDLASTWETARTQVAGFVRSARQLLEEVAPLLHNVGQLSTSDWEDFVNPLKLMVEGMGQIASLAHLFEGGNLPSLAGLGAGLRQLAVDARQLLVDLDVAVGPVGPLLGEKLKNLGEAAAGARAVADGALGLVRSLQEALTVDWGGINFGDAGRMMHDLAGMVLWFAEKAQDASIAIGKVDTTGLAPLKASAENLIGIADGARSLVAKLVDALSVKWGEVKWSDAGRMMADLARMVIYFSEKALTYADALKDLDLGPLGQMKTAADSLLGIAEGARTTTLALVAALKVDWGAVAWSDAGRLMADMGRMVVFFAERALTYAAALKNLDTGALAQLKAAAEAVQGAAAAAWSLVQFALDTLKFDWSKVSLHDMTDSITRLILAGQQLARAAREAMGAWSIEAMPALTGLGTVLQDSLSVVQTVFDLIDRVVHGGIPSGILATSRWDSTSPLQDAIWRVVLAAQQIGQAVHDAMGAWTVTVPPGLANLKTVLSDSLGIFEDTFKAIDLIMGGANPASLGAAFTPDAHDTYNRSPIWQRISALLIYATSLADMIRLSIGTWNMTVPPGLTTLKGVLSDSLGIFEDTFKIVGLVMGDGYAGLNAAAFTPDSRDTWGRSPIWQRISALIIYATSLADMIRLSIGTWNMTVPPGLTTLKGVLSGSLGIIQDTFSIVDALMGEGAAGLAGPSFDAGAANPVAQRLGRLLGAAQAIAEAANTAMTGWDIQVNESFKHLAAVLKASLEAATDTLDLNSLLGGKTAPTFDVEMLKARLAQTLQAGRDLADQANLTLAGWDIVVKDSFKHLADVLKGSLDVATSTLDLGALLGGKTPPALDVDMLKTRLAQVIVAGRDLAGAANAAIAAWDIQVKDSFKHLADVLKSSLDVVGSVLNFSELQSRLANFRGLDMRVVGPKLDMIIASAIAVAQEFGQRAAGAGIKEEWQKAGAALKSLFGDAVDSLLKAVDLGEKLADPATQIPSVGQVQAKLTAVLDFLGAVTSQFSASASSLASSGVDFTAVTQIATSAKSAFDVIMSAVDTISTLREKHIGMDDLDNIRQFLRQVFTIFNEFNGQTVGVEAVTSAVTTLLGGLQTLASTSGFSAGQSWASQFAAGINAGLGNVTEGATRALARLTGGGGTGNGNVTITTNTYHNTYNNSLSLNVDTANAEAVTLNFNLLEAMSGA